MIFDVLPANDKNPPRGGRYRLQRMQVDHRHAARCEAALTVIKKGATLL
jgi:hypothetical protein